VNKESVSLSTQVSRQALYSVIDRRVCFRVKCNIILLLSAASRLDRSPLDWLIDWLLMMGWDYVSELRSPTGLLFIPQVICEHGEPWLWWCRLGITPDSSTRALWQSYQQRHLDQVGVMDEGVRISPISICSTSKNLLHAVKSYNMGLPALLPIRGKVCYGFFYRPWSPSPQPGLNSRPLGPVASTLTSTPPRRLTFLRYFHFEFIIETTSVLAYFGRCCNIRTNTTSLCFQNELTVVCKISFQA
jgi:hypothetical protein